jgi:CDP-glycerol glycerophosphotransferase (TagB/SpsB family)
MKDRAGRLARSVLPLAVAALRRLVRVDPDLVVFGGRNGSAYAGNSRALFEWVVENRRDLRPVWITHNRCLYHILRSKGRPVGLASSWGGLRALLRARVGVFSHSLKDIAATPYLVPPQLPLIALRHGKSVKRVRFARLNRAAEEPQRRQREYETSLIRYAISTSEFISDLQEETLRIGRARHIVTGYPRNDSVLHPSAETELRWARFLAGRTTRHVVLYAPTWRHGTKPTRFFPFEDMDWAVLEEFLSRLDILLLLRPHANDGRLYPDLSTSLADRCRRSGFLRLCSNEVIEDVSDVLPFVDVLVTDYSSLYHDFLLLDRPMIFLPYDYEAFSQDVGFQYDYFAHLPGPWTLEFREWMDILEAALRGEESAREARRQLRQRIHTYSDGRASARVAALIDRVRSEAVKPA